MATKTTKRAAQSVIDALLVLTQAGLLTWKVDDSGPALITRPRFTLFGSDLILEHDADSLTVTREQACAIGYAANDFKKAQGA